MAHLHKPHQHFYGTTTIGEKGQVVIPAEARQALNLKKGEKMLVFGMGSNMVTLTKLAHLAEFEAHLMQGLKEIRRARIKATK